MQKVTILAAAAGFCALMQTAAQAALNYDDIQTVVVIYAENRSFDNLFGTFPGANGLAKASATSVTQLDRNGSTLSGLPAIWGGMTGGVLAGAPLAPVLLSETQTGTYLNTFNHPFDIAALYASVTPENMRPLLYTTRDLYHRFYENQMQINSGANNAFAAWADSGGLVMGYYGNTTSDHPLWALAQKFTLADNFFQPAFGSSYLNHQFLICACAPYYPDNGDSSNPQPFNPWTQQATVYNGQAAANNSTAPAPSVLNANTTSLATKSTSPPSALAGPPQFVNSSVITPYVAVNGTSHFWSVNTSQPPWLPSGNADGPADAPQSSVNTKNTSTLPPQTQTTIGDLLTNAGVNFAYYAGAFAWAESHAPYAAGTSKANPNFQYHHQPFNYFERFDPSRPAGQKLDFNPNPTYVATTDPIYANSGAAERAAHLKDGGVATPTDIANQTLPASDLKTDITNGTLPPVTFYKPQGTVNEHPGYANVTDGDQHIAAVVAALQASPQWPHMLIIVTYDEFGGQWDHVAPPKGDYFGPGTRIPAIIISPYAKQGYIDHTQYDTTSVLRFITNKWNLPKLPGITLRDTSLVANGNPAMGDLTNALDLR